MLVCVNHHLALVRLRIPRAYVAFLADPTCSATAPAAAAAAAVAATEPAARAAAVPAAGLRVTRSRWWDMFAAEDRMEAARAVCGALAWLMRETEGTGGWRPKEV